MLRKGFGLMMMGTVVRTLWCIPVIFFLGSFSSADIPHMINYQGKLTTASGGCLNDTVSMTFTIYSDSLGTSAGWTETQTQVVVKEGVFSVLLGSVDSIPASVFDGNIKYLGVQVESDQEMRPLKSMVSVAYAYKSLKADTADYAHMGDSDWTFRITDTADTTLMTGGAWGIARYGNILYGNTDSTHVNLGVECTTGSSGYNVKYCTVGGGMHNTASNSYSTVGGGSHNTASGCSSTVSGGAGNTASGFTATVGGGGSNTAGNHHATVGGGEWNTASNAYSTVGGGLGNTASNQASTVGGGWYNTASNWASTVGGGEYNTANSLSATVAGGDSNTASGYYSTVGGGRENTASSEASTVGGGYFNTASDRWSTVGGGAYNAANGNGTVGGGRENTASGSGGTVGGGGENTASGGYSTVGGGVSNTASGSASTVGGGWWNTASGDSSTIGGGYHNTASGEHSTVGGGTSNLVQGDYSAILGGYADTITSTADYSFLFGIGSKLTADSTFMVDMPHVRFGDESSGYEFPTSDGAGGQVMTTDGNGQLSWIDASGGGGWIDDGTIVRLNTGTDSVGIGTSSPHAKLHIEGTLRVTDKANIGPNNINPGTNAFVAGYSNGARGDASTVGGGAYNGAEGYSSVIGGGYADTAFGDYSTISGGYLNRATLYCTIGGGVLNFAGGNHSTVGGGNSNTTSDDCGTVSGGFGNTASGGSATVGGGWENTASGDSSTVGGGGHNTASGGSATVGGGIYNTASGLRATVTGGYADTAAGDYSLAAGSGVRISSDADYSFAFGRDFVTSTPNAVILHNSVDPIKVGIGTTSPTEELHVVGDIYCTGKLTSDGGNDPPYVLYNKETRKAIEERVAKEVPVDKLDGAVLFWNGDASGFEVYLPAKGEFRDLLGTLLATVDDLKAAR